MAGSSSAELKNVTASLFFRTTEIRHPVRFLSMADHRLYCRQNQGISAPQHTFSQALRQVSEYSPAEALPEIERRQDDSRIAQSIPLRISALSPNLDPLVIVLDGIITNASRGGVCISTAWPLTPATSLRCEVLLAGEIVRIPTLMQVRWVKTQDDGAYRCGLLYLI